MICSLLGSRNVTSWVIWVVEIVHYIYRDFTFYRGYIIYGMSEHTLEYKLLVGFISSLIAGIVVLVWEYRLRDEHVRTAAAIHALVDRARSDSACRHAYVDAALKIASRERILALTGVDLLLL